MSDEILKQVELLLGSIGVILSLFFSFFLFINRKKQPVWNLFLAIYLLAFGLRIGKSVFHYFYAIDPGIRNFFLTIIFCVGPSIWLYTKYLVLEQKNIVTKDLTHYFLFLFLLPICWFIPNNGPDKFSPFFALFYNSIIVHLCVYTGYALFWFIKNNERSSGTTNLVIKKRWLRHFLVANFIFVILYGIISYVEFPFYIGISYLFSLLIVFVSIWALNNPKLFKITAEKYSTSNLSAQQAEKIVLKLKSHFAQNKSFLNPELTLQILSEEIEVSSKELSQAINQHTQNNYAQFIMQFRIDEAKRLLLSNSHKKYTMAAIAYDSGFNSISSFNSAFKKIEGTTPLAFQNNAGK